MVLWYSSPSRLSSEFGSEYPSSIFNIFPPPSRRCWRPWTYGDHRHRSWRTWVIAKTVPRKYMCDCAPNKLVTPSGRQGPPSVLYLLSPLSVLPGAVVTVKLIIACRALEQCLAHRKCSKLVSCHDKHECVFCRAFHQLHFSSSNIYHFFKAIPFYQLAS